MVLARPFVVQLAAVVLIALGGSAIASEEEFLDWAEVRIAGPDRADTGKVVFSAKTSDAKYGEVRIEAFGKTYTVYKDELLKLNGFPLNSLRISHEAGYERLGGHMVHFKLKKVYRDGEGRLVEDNVVISVSKGRGLVVPAPRQRVIEEAPTRR